MKKLLVTLCIAAVSLGFAARCAKAETIWYIDGYAYPQYEDGLFLESVSSVDFGVWPVAPGHVAGAVYTIDGWNTVQWGSASWEYNVPNDYGSYDEHWNWYQNLNGPQPTHNNPVYLWFALYVDDQYGNRYWDNNGGWNYQLISSCGC